MENEITPIQLAVHYQCAMYRDHARAADDPNKLTRDEMQALTELRNESAEAAGVALATVIGASQVYMHRHEPRVMRALMGSAGMLPLAKPRVQLTH